VTQVKVPRHMHVNAAGAQYACPMCNPVCWQAHRLNNPIRMAACGNPRCPLDPRVQKMKLNPRKIA